MYVNFRIVEVLNLLVESGHTIRGGYMQETDLFLGTGHAGVDLKDRFKERTITWSI